MEVYYYLASSFLLWLLSGVYLVGRIEGRLSSLERKIEGLESRIKWWRSGDEQ